MVDTAVSLATLWTDRCDIFIMQSSLDSITKRTMLNKHTLYSNIPCKLSYRSLSAENVTVTQSSNGIYSVDQAVTLFLSKDITIPDGSMVTVYSKGRTLQFTRSGEPCVFSGHQQISLRLADRFA